MGKSERVEGQEFLHTADGPTDYLCSATVIPVQKSLVNFCSLNDFLNS
jgi:hypothetical protein